MEASLLLGALIGAALAVAGGMVREIWTDRREARAVARTLKLELEGNLQQLEIEESLPEQAHLRLAEPQDLRRTAWETSGVAVMRVASQRRADSIARAYLGQPRYVEALDGRTDVTFGHLEARFVNEGIQAVQPLTEKWRWIRQLRDLGEARHPGGADPPHVRPGYVGGVTVVSWRWRSQFPPAHLFKYLPRYDPTPIGEPAWRAYVFPYGRAFADFWYPLDVADVPVLGRLVVWTREAWAWVHDL